MCFNSKSNKCGHLLAIITLSLYWVSNSWKILLRIINSLSKIFQVNKAVRNRWRTETMGESRKALSGRLFSYSWVMWFSRWSTQCVDQGFILSAVWWNNLILWRCGRILDRLRWPPTQVIIIKSFLIWYYNSKG